MPPCVFLRRVGLKLYIGARAIYRLVITMGKKAAASQKRLRSTFGGIRGVADSALAKVLLRVKREPSLLEDVPDSVRKVTDAMGIRKMIKDTPHLFQQLVLPMKDGEDFNFLYANLQNLFLYLVDVAPAFKQCVVETLARHPAGSAAPWHMVFYLDEVTPGNPMRPDNARKVWGFYVTFREFAKSRLSQTRFWLPLGALRTHTAREVEGGLSNVVRLLLRSIFLGPTGWSTVGVPVPLEGGKVVLLHAELSNILGDEAALSKAVCTKGAGGVVPCILCKNCVCKENDENPGGGLATFGAGYVVDISEKNAALFDRASDADIEEKHDLLRELDRLGTTKGEFEKVEKALGLTYNPLGLLSDMELRPFVRVASSWTYDPTHVCFCSGIAHREIDEFLRCLKLHQVGFASLAELMTASWHWPRFKQSKVTNRQVQDVFSDARQESFNNNGFKASGSEILVIYPILRWLCADSLEPNGVAIPEVQSFIAMCAVLDHVRPGTFCKNTALLDQAVSEHMAKFISAYSASLVKPKHHMAHHQGEQLRRDGMLLDTWAPERFHKITKSCVDDVTNTVAFERSCIVRLVASVVNELETPARDRLLGKCTPCDELEPGATMSPGMVTIENLNYAMDDIVFVDDTVLVCVLSAVSTSSGIGLLVETLVDVRLVRTKAWRCRRKESISMLDPARHSLVHAACWAFEDNGDILVLE